MTGGKLAIGCFGHSNAAHARTCFGRRRHKSAAVQPTASAMLPHQITRSVAVEFSQSGIDSRPSRLAYQAALEAKSSGSLLIAALTAQLDTAPSARMTRSRM